MSQQQIEWPRREYYVTHTMYGDTMTLAQIADYQNARADAWERAARLAVEALDAEKRSCRECKGSGKVITWDVNSGPLMGKCQSCADVHETLAAIGPLPQTDKGAT